MKLGSFISCLLLANSCAMADSSCWPEELLLGKTAQGFIEGANYNVFKTTEAQSNTIAEGNTKCEIKTYLSPTEKDPKTLACEKLECIKGMCGDGGDYTSLPVEQSKSQFAQVSLTDNQKAWIKINSGTEIRPILPKGKLGKIFPATTKLLDSPNGKPVKLVTIKDLAYTLKKLTRVNNEDWAEVEIAPIISEEPPIKLDKPIGKGFFLHRTKENKITAVLSDIWCD